MGLGMTKPGLWCQNGMVCELYCALAVVLLKLCRLHILYCGLLHLDVMLVGPRCSTTL